jgi:hypothetical protein
VLEDGAAQGLGDLLTPRQIPRAGFTRAEATSPSHVAGIGMHAYPFVVHDRLKEAAHDENERASGPSRGSARRALQRRGLQGAGLRSAVP